MCGIIGMIARRDVAADLYEGLIQLQHRGPDSYLNHVSVYRARLRMGENLAMAWKRRHPDATPEVVVPVPFSSVPMALSFAHSLGIKYSEGLYKNAFVGRTFIMPGSKERNLSVKRKLSPLPIELSGKRVMLVDDSIVRGLTSQEVVRMVRSAGAKEVFFASACPPVVNPDFYGIDIPTREELIAAQKSEEEIREFIGCDILLYQAIDDLVEAIIRKGEHAIDRLSMPYLDGWYVTGGFDEGTITNAGKQRLKERDD